MNLRRFSTRTFLFAIVAVVCVSIGLSYGRRSFDFWIYWEAAQLLLSGRDPYLLPASSVGAGDGYIGNWYPPTLFSAVLPLAILSFNSAQVIWTSFLIASIVTPVTLLYGCGEIPRKTALLTVIGVGVTFFPIYPGLYFGQASQLMIGSVALFMFRTITSRRDICADALAGLLLSITTIKPHSVSLLIVYLALTSWRRRQWSTLLSYGAGAITLATIPAIFNPEIFASWLHSVAQGGAVTWVHATLPANIKMLTHSHSSVVITLAPALMAMCYVPFIRGANDAYVIPMLIAGSVLLAPYGWIHDYGVLLPGIVLYIHRFPIRFGVAVILLNLCGILLLQRVDQNVFIFYPIALLLLMYLNTSRKTKVI